MILAGDIGGTKTALGLFEAREGGLRTLREEKYRSAEHGSLGEMVADFLGRGTQAPLRAACFGVAGPVIAGRAKLTNLSWSVDVAELTQAVPAPRIALLNDLQAVAIGAMNLPREALHPLNAAPPPAAVSNIAVIAAGTGLGQGFLVWDGDSYHPGASEGGHAAFAPRDPLDDELLRHLRAEHGVHVSWERILSGPGIVGLYRFLRARSGTPEPAWLAAALSAADAGVAITDAALEGRDPVCIRTLDLFSALYGAEAGTLALKVFALGGVFIGGGIAPRILPFLDRAFMPAFTAKGRFSTLLESIPVKVVMDTRAALLGAAHHAQEIAQR